MADRLAFVWDYDIDAAQFQAILAGELAIGRLNRDWAAIRLLEYGAYADIVRLPGFAALVQAGQPGATTFVPRRGGAASTFSLRGCHNITLSCFNDCQRSVFRLRPLYLLQDDVLQARILDSASQNDWATIR